jgi:hypothetical protein
MILKTSSNYTVSFVNPSVSGMRIDGDKRYSSIVTHAFGAIMSLFNYFTAPTIPPAEKPYRWKRLSNPRATIRLLELFPGDGAAELEGRLFETQFTEDLEYIAISYTWGSELRQFRLNTPEGRVPLTISLFLGLRRLRQKQLPVLIWADAICINQEDNQEKSHQIRIMVDIFRSAKRVYAWLGEEQDHSRQAIDFLTGLVPKVAVDGVFLPKAATKLANEFPKVDDPIWNALTGLLERSWFRRVWVIQELVLARELSVICGDQELPWDEFYRVVKACFDVVQELGFGFVLSKNSKAAAILNLGEFRRLSRNKDEFVAQDNLLSLFELFHRANATRRRDKLFGLLGLAKDADAAMLNPDYTVPLETIVKRYARVFVQSEQTLQLLYRARISSHPERFPSWIPNWTSDPYPSTITTWPRRTRSTPYVAATSLKLDAFLLSGNDSPLCVYGRVVDRIQHRGQNVSSTTVIRSYLSEIFKTVETVYGDLADEKMMEIKRTLPIGNANKPSRGHWGIDKGHTSFQALSQFLQQRDVPDERVESQVILSVQNPSLPSSSDLLHRRMQPYVFTAIDFADQFSAAAVVCVTKNQRVGIVPDRAQPGDEIVLFHGSEVPIVIRFSLEKNGKYEVIGECYIHGLMYGESTFPEDVRPQYIQLA